jgi:hypothetical protein
MKKIIMALLISFVAYQTTQTIDPSSLKDQQEIYSFYQGGMYNPDVPGNGTFETIAKVSLNADGNKITVANGKTYLLTASTTATKIGYVESKYVYVDKSKYITGVSVEVEDLELILDNWTANQVHNACWAGNEFLQTYPTLEDGFIVLVGTNKAGNKNGYDSVYSTLSVPLFYYTLYSPVYGTELFINQPNLTDAQQIYSFNATGMYSPLIQSNATFKPIATVIPNADGSKYTILDGKTYTLPTTLTSADTNASIIGYVESEYVTGASLEDIRLLVAGNEYSLIWSAAPGSSFLQTYPTLNNGYLALLGTNKAGQPNGKTAEGTWNYTLYAPVYGKEIAAA